MTKDLYSIMCSVKRPGGKSQYRYLLRDKLGRQVFGAKAMNRLRRKCLIKKISFTVIVHSAKFPTPNRFSTHFSKSEFACHDPRKTQVPRSLYGNARRLAIALELIRALTGNTPISLNSVYRTKAWNDHIGGARFSKHMYALAADLNVTAKSRPRFIIAAKKIDMIKGIGIYPWGGLHVDVRRGPRVFWNDWNR